jgi:hypothetical protein
MLKLDRMLVLIDAFEEGISMVGLYRKVGLRIKNYCSMIKAVKFLEKKGVIVCVKKGRCVIISRVYKNKIDTFDKIFKLLVKD